MKLESIAKQVFYMMHPTPRCKRLLGTRLALELSVENNLLPREALTKRTSSINRKIKTLGLKRSDLPQLEVELPIPANAKMFVVRPNYGQGEGDE